MKQAAIALFLLLAASMLISAGTPTTGDITLRIKDAQQRPVPGVSATIEYTATDSILGEIRKTDVVKSDPLGIISHRIVADFNTECRISISHNYADDLIELTWLGTTDRFVNLPLSDFSIRVVDSTGNPIGNAPLRIETEKGSFNSTTNATGYKIFSQYNRELSYDVFATYGAREFAARVVPDNKLYTIQVPTYSLEIRTLDGEGRSLETEMALTYVATESITRRTRGIAGLFTQIPEGNVTLVITREGQQLNTTFYLNSSITRIFTFDEAAPTISMPWTVPAKPVPENEVQVLANVSDGGASASGMPQGTESTVLLNYSADGGANWQAVAMRQKPAPDNSTYFVVLPGFPPNKSIRYVIIATDSAGNRATSPQYILSTVVVPDGSTPQQGTDTTGILMQLWWAPVLVIIAAIAYYLFGRKKSQPSQEQ